MRRTIALALVSVLVWSSPAGAGDRLKIVASFTVLGDIVRQVAGDDADVVTLVGPDGDAHVFEPSPADARTVAEADILVVNGLGLDGWTQRLARAAGFHGEIVDASAGIEPRVLPDSGAPDPHAWQDLKNGAHYVRTIAAALAHADAAHAADYSAAALSYVRELDALDRDVRRQIAAVPEARRKVITSHDAFGYFGAAYGVIFLAPEGISTESEASAGDLARLMDQVRREHVRALFVETITDPRMMKMISDETGAELGGALYSDALSRDGGPAPHYVDMFRNNVPKLVEGMLRN
jgi:zinc/manganese transport system substrate-binding protein